MRPYRLVMLSCMMLFVAGAGRGADPDVLKTATTPEEALKLLCEYAKEGNLEGHLSLWAEPSLTFSKCALESEKTVAILQRTLDEKLGTADKDKESKIGGIWLTPGKEGNAYVAFQGKIVPDGLKVFPEYHKWAVAGKETRPEGTVVLTLKQDKETVKFTAIKTRSGWQLNCWGNDASEAALCRKLHEKAKVVILEVAREVKEGKITRREAAWGTVYDNIQALADPQSKKLPPDGKPELAPPPTKN